MKRQCKNVNLNRKNYMMNEERRMVMQQVLEGNLPASAVTMEEIHEVEEILFELIADRKTPFATWETLQ